MTLNPLSIPFGNVTKPRQQVPIPNFIGVKNERVRDSATAQAKIKIQVQGVKGQPNATYEVEFQEGAPLKQYLDQLKLKYAAITSTVRDLANLSAGHLRLRYVPTQGSHITLGHPDLSPAFQLQRSRVDTRDVVARMGSDKIVERKLY